MSKVNRNDPCPCGSGKKYKQCCMNKDQEPRRLRAALAAQLAAEDTSDETAKLLATYEEKFEEIEKLTEAMESHQLEFQRVMNNPKALAEKAHQLFADENFESYRYNAAQIQEACKAAAYADPPAKGTPEYGQFLILTTGYLADRKRRLEIGLELLNLIPGKVEEEAYMDAWLLQLAAYQMVETPNEANLFLTEMLNYGLQEWQGEPQE
jgi:hypothetical protein